MRRGLARWADPATPRGMLLTIVGAILACAVLVWVGWVDLAAQGFTP